MRGDILKNTELWAELRAEFEQTKIEKICNAIQDEVGFELPMEKAKVIWDFATNKGEFYSLGWDVIEEELEVYIAFVKELFAA